MPETTILPEITSAATPLAGSADCSAYIPENLQIVPSDSDIAQSDIALSDTGMATLTAPEVGHHKDGDSEKSCCFRPGCYVRFAVTARSPRQCFCSSACRNALRRVRQRETHWFRQLGLSSRHRGPPADDVD